MTWFVCSWGSGANPWGGVDKEDQFAKPNHYDGVLEVVGVTGVAHLGQIQSGLRSAVRIAQGGHIKIHLKSEIPVQVDGEPWVQSPGDIVVLKSAVKVRKPPFRTDESMSWNCFRHYEIATRNKRFCYTNKIIC